MTIFRDMVLVVVPVACRWIPETNLPTSEYLVYCLLSKISRSLRFFKTCCDSTSNYTQKIFLQKQNVSVWWPWVLRNLDFYNEKIRSKFTSALFYFILFFGVLFLWNKFFLYCYRLIIASLLFVTEIKDKHFILEVFLVLITKNNIFP